MRPQREPGREDTGNHSVCSTAYIPVNTSPGVFHRAAVQYNISVSFALSCSGGTSRFLGLNHSWTKR
ncbi:hypothetical protein E2C01_086898 [Portunus trituberculatus]|uniref:Uncharacterized protein n=1 Tax=Portunus trituberculatus TaxID=210409 RepID=A0A5B7JFV9_PORTR|nr:hypothetical protein [Portunus trituberculatus]